MISGGPATNMTTDVIDELRYATAGALVRRVGTQVHWDTFSPGVSFGDEWQDSRVYEYDIPAHIGEKLGMYENMERTIKTFTGLAVSSAEPVTFAQYLVLQPSELTVNIDSEAISAEFSRSRTPRKMFPGVYEKMNELFGG